MLRWFREHTRFLVTGLIPLSLVVIDALLRFSLRIDLIDLGADMALFSVSAFTGVLMEDFRIAVLAPDRKSKQTSLNQLICVISFLALFGIVWLLCLIAVSPNPLYERFSDLLRFRPFIAWGLGIGSIVAASVVLWEMAITTFE